LPRPTWILEAPLSRECPLGEEGGQSAASTPEFKGCGCHPNNTRIVNRVHTMWCALSIERVKTLTFAGMISASRAEANGAQVPGKFGVSTIETNAFTHWGAFPHGRSRSHATAPSADLALTFALCTSAWARMWLPPYSGIASRRAGQQEEDISNSKHPGDGKQGSLDRRPLAVASYRRMMLLPPMVGTFTKRMHSSLPSTGLKGIPVDCRAGEE
jgi:hypothetical protein